MTQNLNMFNYIQLVFTAQKAQYFWFPSVGIFGPAVAVSCGNPHTNANSIRLTAIRQRYTQTYRHTASRTSRIVTMVG